MEKAAIAITPSTPEELVAFTAQQVNDVRRTLREAGVQPE